MVLNTQHTFVIAEIGINHGGNLDEAFKLIDAAKASGADAAKFQTYITEQRVPADSPIFGILKQCEISFEDQAKLFAYGKEQGVVVFSTPFDEESVDFLESVNCPLYKIASFDSVNKKLIKKVAGLNKETIISTGMTSQDELDTAVSFFANAKEKLSILHCMSSYPLKPEDANLSVINHLKQRYPEHTIGFSDHSIGVDVPVFAVAAGAKIVEKHFTLDTQAQGPDHALSADPAMLKAMVDRIREVEQILGSPQMGVRPAEADIVPFRRATEA